MKIYTLIGDIWHMDGGVAYGVIPKKIWGKLTPSDENNFIPMITRCLLIIDGDKKILVETGMGDKQNERYYEVRGRNKNYSIKKSLNNIGISANEITDIIFTHLHDDHVGAATYRIDNQINHTFVNANYWVSKLQWDWAIERNKREEAAFLPENLLPLKDCKRLNLINENEQPFNNIELRIFNGHTVGQIIPLIKFKNAVIVYGGDFLPSVFHFPYPYIAAADIQPLVSLKEKEEFLPEAYENKYHFCFCHDFDVETSNIKLTDKGFISTNHLSMAELLNNIK